MTVFEKRVVLITSSSLRAALSSSLTRRLVTAPSDAGMD